ncbi:efflux RND transporter periplasmic adaptor subunit [Acidovorax sp. GBBC 3334]|uniref:efflux RND transporter periplasmic adaptor subunit n=1 Tax=Acidovorax sp. GBBC 3334 TaxID=2940496 RepID=UPI0023043DA6|nr:efflux RND transporter periplasmic adaptor subunit [Acidovorax sp. GBBC 3334]MDA8455104.1 efflux RND transporter periplasmic adaptor subunit [Acidovorax sp. GBBC 3334]
MLRLRSRPSLLALAAACLIAAAGGTALLFAPGALHAEGAKDGKGAAAAAPRPALTVTTTTPRRESLAARLPANGNVAAWQEASIGAESNGLRLTEVRVNVGDTVRAGQVLAVFSADTVQAEVAQSRASLLEARAGAAEAAANAERARTLQASGALSQQQIQQYTTASETAAARVEAAQAVLSAQQLRLKHTQVLAPDSGVISARTATVGAVVGAGTELFRMVRKGRLEWRAEVTSSDLPRVQPGTRARITAASGAEVEGTVRVVAPTVDPQTRNALVYVDLPAHPDIRAGMFARGDFLLAQRDILTVPQSAVVVRDGFSTVFEVGDGGRVAMRQVKTGQRVGDRVEVLSGLQERATLVERGGAFLNEGDTVRVEAATAPKPGSSSPHAAGSTAKSAIK